LRLWAILTTMMIDLASVTSTPRPLAAEVDGAQIDLGDEGSVQGIVSFSGEIVREAQRPHLRGTVSADVLLQCTRCAEELVQHLEVPFEDVFVEAADETTDADHEIGGDELDEQLVTSNDVDLMEIIREQILLNLPEQVFCKEDCEGLCPHCGTNLNVESCNCGDQDIDPRWAALKNLN
jgi:uncharacterized protein